MRQVIYHAAGGMDRKVVITRSMMSSWAVITRSVMPTLEISRLVRAAAKVPSTAAGGQNALVSMRCAAGAVSGPVVRAARAKK